MKVKVWLKYLFYITILLIMVVLKGYVNNLIDVQLEETFQVNYIHLLIGVLVNVCIGMVLGLEHLFREIKKDGLWKINIPKLILVGLPTLYLSLPVMFMYSTNLKFIQKIVVYPYLHVFKFGLSNVGLFQLVFGFIIITCFYKKDELILVNSDIATHIK